MGMVEIFVVLVVLVLIAYGLWRLVSRFARG
jgi:hypothetical protein